MKNRFFKSFLLLIGWISQCWATTSFDAASYKAQSLLHSEVSCVQVGVDEADTCYYFFKGQNGGYAVVSHGDEPRVFAYHPTLRISSDTLPAHLQECIRRMNSSTKQSMKPEYSQPSSNLRASRLEGYSIEPLLKDMCWGQKAPFNGSIPQYEGNPCVAGCSAVSIAMTMNYYQYPSKTAEDIPSYITSTYSLEVEGVKKGTAIDWKNILNDYSKECSTRQKEAAANLLSMVATSIETDFTDDQSSSEYEVAWAMINYFGYDREQTRRFDRRSFTLSEWSQLILEELEAGRPVILSGNSMGGGHGFICDGIDVNGLFHINWGWDGDYNGYYDISLLDPPCNDGTGASSTEDGYNQKNQVVVGIMPDNGKVDALPETIVCATEVHYQMNEKGNHFLFFSYMAPYAFDCTRYVGYGYLDKEGNVVCLSNFGMTTIEHGKEVSQKRVASVDVSSFEDGETYKIVLIESEDGKSWKISQGSNVCFATFGKEEGVVTKLEDAPVLKGVLTADTFEKLFEEIDCHVTVTNTGGQEYYGIVYVMTSTTTENPMKYTFATGLSVESMDDNQYSFSFTPRADTMYYWIMDEKTQTIGEGIIAKTIKGAGLEDASPSSNLMMHVEESTLYLSAKMDTDVCVISLDGKVVFQGRVSKDTCLMLPLKKGVYWVNGEKVLLF